MSKVQPRIVALVPMRHQSERVPGKNYRPFAGRPLYHHIVLSLLATDRFAEVVIDTDSEVIRDDARMNFPSIRILDRPIELRPGEVPMNDILLHDTAVVEADYYVQTHSTNPLLRPGTIRSAIDALLCSLDRYDSLLSVTARHVRLWTHDGRAINHDPSILLRTQDLPPIYEENSCLYIFNRMGLERRRNRIGDRPLMFEIEASEAWDIDEEWDFEVGEFLFACRRDADASQQIPAQRFVRQAAPR